MLKKIGKAQTVDITWQGEVVASVRAISPADLTDLLITVGEDLAAVFNVVEEIDQLKLDTKKADKLADQLLQQWPKIVTAVGTHLPNVLAQIIARTADEPEMWEEVRDNYSFALQFEILVEVAKLTFNDPEGFRRFVGNVLALVDLSGSLTSNVPKKQEKTRAVRPSSVAG
jgi:hypothetical protein